MPRRTNQDPFEREPGSTPRQRSAAPEKRRRKWPWVLLFLLVVLLLLPNIVGWFGLHQYALPYALKDFDGKANFKSASMGWFQPVRLSGVEITDKAGNPLLTAANIETSRPLHAFLTSSDYGEVTVDQPFVFLDLFDGGSNFEDALAKYIDNARPSPLDKPKPERDPNKKPAALPSVVLKINEGSAIVRSRQTVPNQIQPQAENWRIDSLNAVVDVGSEHAPLAAAAQCVVSKLNVDAQGQPTIAESGTLVLNANFDQGRKNLRMETADVRLETNQLPLSIVAPLAHRFIGPATTSGNATMKLDAAYSAAQNEVAANIESLQLASASIEAPQTLGQDRLLINSVVAAGNIDASPAKILAKDFRVETDFGYLTADGQFDPAQIAKLGGGGQLLDDPLQMQGEVDLAKLLRALPDTFQLHNDLNVESGVLSLNAGTRNEQGVRRLVFNMDTANIRASRAGQPIVWQQPLRIVGVLRELDGQFSLENFQCVSDFLNIEGSATLNQALFKTSGDLGQLAQRVGQFVDLGGNQFAGKLDGQFGWGIEGEATSLTYLAARPIQIGGDFVVQQPQIQFAGMPVWKPQQVQLKVSAGGSLNRTEQSMTLPLSQAGVQLDIGSEKAVFSLAQPVADAFSQGQWVFNTQVVGQVEGWLAHVRNFVDPGDIAARGAINFAGITIVDADRIALQDGQFEIQQLGFEGYGAKIQEDRVVGGAAGSYGLVDGQVAIQQANLQGTSLSASAQDLQIAFAPDGSMAMDGSAAWRADVNRLAEWFSLSTTPESIYWYGASEGTIKFTSSPQGTRGVIRSDMSDMVTTQRTTVPQQNNPMQLVGNVNQAWVELWKEPRVEVNGQFDISPDFGSLALEQFSLRSDSLDVDTTGKITSLISGYPELDLEGIWKPNFDRVNPLLDVYTSNMVAVQGSHAKPFRVRGPVFPTGSEPYVPGSLQVQTQLSWDGATVLGIPIGATDIGVDLASQVASLNTSGIEVSGGIVQLQPQIDFRDAQPILTHGQARLLDRVELTPELVRDGLKFVAPWLADSTRAQGKVSAELMGMNVPLFDPMNLSARGTLEMEDVVVAAGPTAEQLLSTVNQIQAILKPEQQSKDRTQWLQIERQSVPIAVENRRVYHENIKFSHDDVIIRTSGSVGFVDQTLDLVAKIPIAEDWIAGKPYLSGLKGQFISVPIRGTATRPVVDQNEVRRLSADLVKNAASGALNNAITDKLNPKLQQYQNEFSDKVGGEVNKLQSKFQDKLGGFLNNKLGAPATGGQATGPLQPGGQQTPQSSIEERIEGGLQKGLNKLFGK